MRLVNICNGSRCSQSGGIHSVTVDSNSLLTLSGNAPTVVTLVLFAVAQVVSWSLKISCTQELLSHRPHFLSGRLDGRKDGFGAVAPTHPLPKVESTRARARARAPRSSTLPEPALLTQQQRKPNLGH